MGGGGSRVQQGTTGLQILKETYDKNKQKDLTEKQRTAQIQKQTQDQAQLRRSAKTEEPRESEEKRSEDNRQRQPAQRARGKQGPKDTKSMREEDMSRFQKRQSLAERHRQAGREMTQRKQSGPQNPHGWSVLNSPQTTPQARSAILARQESTGQEPQARNLPQGQTTYTPARGQPATKGRMIFQYAQTRSRGQQARQPFQQRYLNSQQITRQIAQMVAQQQGAQGRAALAQQAGVLVHLHGNFVFVREGKKTRAFRLNRDGSLSELPSEDASDQPLSPEARALLKKVLANRGIKSRADRGQSAKSDALRPGSQGETLGKEGALSKEEIETRFAMLLHEVLEEEGKVGKELKEGEDPQFPTKEDWEAFFARLGNLGNQEKLGKKTLDKILSLLFRGLFNKKGKGKYLVGDLQYQQDGKGREEKFAQIPVNQAELAKLLASLKPGQRIDMETLKKFFGEELAFLKMAHVSQKTYNMAEGAERGVLFNPKSGIDPYSQARLERSIFGSRKRSGGEIPSELPKEMPPRPKATGVFANVYELMGLREKYEGRPRFYTLVAYLIITGAIGLSLALLLYHFL